MIKVKIQEQYKSMNLVYVADIPGDEINKIAISERLTEIGSDGYTIISNDLDGFIETLITVRDSLKEMVQPKCGKEPLSIS